jgi:hypothetical protein
MSKSNVHEDSMNYPLDQQALFIQMLTFSLEKLHVSIPSPFFHGI